MVGMETFERRVNRGMLIVNFGERRGSDEFTLERGTSTTVTRMMQGSILYFMKLLGIFVTMDRMMGTLRVWPSESKEGRGKLTA
jgi:hypothetical protein